jgi:hypothetical protein
MMTENYSATYATCKNYFLEKIKIQEYNEEDKNNFIQLCSILLVYIEIEFNKFKEIQDKNSKSKKQNDHTTERINNKYLHKLIFYFQQVEIYFERFFQCSGSSAVWFVTDPGNPQQIGRA